MAVPGGMAFRVELVSSTGFGVAEREPPEVLPQAAEHAFPWRLPADAQCGFPRATSRLDRVAPAGAVDSMGVPGQSCLWILNYSRYVGNVFSFRFLHLHYRDNTLTGATANDVKLVTYRPISEPTN
jgi:hypothetical protein